MSGVFRMKYSKEDCMKKEWKRVVMVCLLISLMSTAVFASGDAEKKQVEEKTINFFGTGIRMERKSISR